MRVVRLLVPAVALAAALASGGASSGAARCPTQTFLTFDGLVYAAERLPASIRIGPRGRIGEGTVDEPTDESGCRRRRDSTSVRRVSGIDPRVAVVAEGRERTVFVLGGRCAGYDARKRWSCLLRPLVFRGRVYTGTRYPRQPRPRRQVPLGRPLGEAELGGERVDAVRITGVDPSLAVGVRGRPGEAFLAPGVCPYERFQNVAERDDLLRCLRSPVWLVFDPPGGRVGSEVRAASDRRLRPELAGATVTLVRLSTVADVVPEDRSGAVRIGALRPSFRLTVPDVPEGLYEAVVACRRCAPAYGGRTLFPAGSLLVAAKREGSSSARIFSLGLGIAVFALAIASVVVWWRGRRRPPSESRPAGS